MFKAIVAPKFLVVILALFLSVGFAHSISTFARPLAAAEKSDQTQDSWLKEFDEVCSKTQQAMSFTEDELTDLIGRCDALAPQSDKLDPSQRKVYVGRLRMCRGLYAYVLDSKKSDSKNNEKK